MARFNPNTNVNLFGGRSGPVRIISSYNVNVNTTSTLSGSFATDVLQFLDNNSIYEYSTASGDSINPIPGVSTQEITFMGAAASPVPTDPGTGQPVAGITLDATDYDILVNGISINGHFDSLVTGSGIQFTINNTTLGYGLDNDDEIILQGKLTV